jgi:hypothetical protein
MTLSVPCGLGAGLPEPLLEGRFKAILITAITNPGNTTIGTK